MNIVFTLQEMKDALIASGHEIREIDIEVDSVFVGQSPKVVKILNVYKNNIEVCNWGETRNFRVDYVFREVLKDRLLLLISGSPGIREIFKCRDCGHKGDSFTQECLPDGNSGEYSNYWLCPKCHSHAGSLI